MTENNQGTMPQGIQQGMPQQGSEEPPCENCGDNNPMQQQPQGGAGMPPFLEQPWEDPTSEREENWRFLTILNIPWHEGTKIADKEDRKFLIGKAKEIEGFLKMQQAMQYQQQQAMQQQQPAGTAPQPVQVNPEEVRPISEGEVFGGQQAVSQV